MYLFAKRKKRDTKQVYLTLANEETEIEIAYWRKHNALHSALSQMATKKGVVKNDMEFNCVELHLTEEDIKDIISSIHHNELVPTDGFFFGSTDYDPSDPKYKNYDLEAFDKALKYLKQGYDVYYYPSW